VTGREERATRGNKNKFSTFGGVFTPSILTIIGVIFFMRAGFVVGQSGVWSALLILVIAKLITFTTGLSISAIATNAPVKGGGAYFLISRSLGPEFGGAIGVTLFFAQAFSVPFYILGFVEALTIVYPSLAPFAWLIGLITATILFGINYVGADWAIRFQYVILALLAASVLAVFGGALMRFDVSTLAENAEPLYSQESYGFWAMFAIYFPAVTGIMAGVNMSGDLRNPQRSIPRGTLAAIGIGFAVYALQIVLLGGAMERGMLQDASYEGMVNQAFLGLGFLVVIGVYAATLSSAMGSFLGAPRILQALAKDDIFAPLKYFAKGRAKGDEPRRALVFTYGLTVAVIGLTALDSEGGGFDFVAAILTMFFLYTYGITNLAAFVESASKNPSFRPRFRFFHWSTALLGAVACLGANLLIDPLAAALALLVLVSLYFYVSRRVLTSTFGDARRGFYFSQLRRNLKHLAALPPHAKNWRPTTLVLSGNPASRPTLTQYAVWFECGRGLVTLAEIIVGRFEDRLDARQKSLNRLHAFIEDSGIDAFPESLIAPDFDQGLANLLQCQSIGPLKPNLVLLGWPLKPDRVKPFTHALRSARSLAMSTVVTVDRGLPPEDGDRRIDVWWRGHHNGSLMVILAHLLTLNYDWMGAQLRILRWIGASQSEVEAQAELERLVDAARIDAEVVIVASTRDFHEDLRAYSADAAVVFLGSKAPEEDEAEQWYAAFSQRFEGLPTVLLVESSGEADLLA